MHLQTVPIALREPTRGIARDIARQPWMRDAKLGDETLGAVASRALQFELVGDGAPSTRELVPQTAAAEQLLDGASGAAMERALRGMLATADARGGQSVIRGISLARTSDEFAANSLMTWIENGDGVQTNPNDPSTAPGLAADIAGAEQMGKAATAQSIGWLNIGPIATRHLERLTSGAPGAVGDSIVGSWLVALGAHEPQHMVSPPRMLDLVKPDGSGPSPINWIEEGTADTLATWPGAYERTRTNMGIPSAPHLPGHVDIEPVVMDAIRSGAARGSVFEPDERVLIDGWITKTYGFGALDDTERLQLAAIVLGGGRNYPTEIDSMHHVLGLAGVDPTDPRDFDAAEQLLQGAPIARVPGRLANAIVTHQGLAAEQLKPIEAAIIGIGEVVHAGDDEWQAAIDRLDRLVSPTRER